MLLLVLLLCLAQLSHQQTGCHLDGQIISGYDSNASTGNITLNDFRILKSPACQAQCTAALETKVTQCGVEMLVCRGNSTFDPDICQPYISCAVNPQGDSRYMPPVDDKDPSWQKQAYTLTCDCPPDRYGHSCEHVRPGMCDGNTSVWDGTFIYDSDLEQLDLDAPKDTKELTCFLNGSSQQPATGFTRSIVAGIRHHRVNVTLGRVSNSTGLVNITWGIISRFRPNNNDHNHNNDPKSHDPQQPPWSKYCLPCDGVTPNPAATTEPACNKLPHNSTNGGKITCLNVNPESPGGKQCSVTLL